MDQAWSIKSMGVVDIQHLKKIKLKKAENCKLVSTPFSHPLLVVFQRKAQGTI